MNAYLHQLILKMTFHDIELDLLSDHYSIKHSYLIIRSYLFHQRVISFLINVIYLNY